MVRRREFLGVLVSFGFTERVFAFKTPHPNPSPQPLSPRERGYRKQALKPPRPQQRFNETSVGEGVGGEGGFAFTTPSLRERGTGGEGFSHLYSAYDDENGAHFLSQIDLLQQNKITQSIPFRAHDLLSLSDSQVIAFGRRPRPKSIVINMASGEAQVLDAAKGRHFYGHGCLSADKSLLFTTENDYDAARGVIGIRDANTFRQIGEYSSYGMGPHDIHLMPDGKTIVVANGGIETHPDYGRRKLNLKTMQPSLVYLEAETGKKLDEYRLDDYLLSIRHLVVTDRGDVGVAAQYQGNLYQQQPKTLVAWQPFGGDLQFLTVPKDKLELCNGYMADLAYDPHQQLLAATSPRGNRLTFWDTRAMRYLHELEIAEVSGIQFDVERGVFLVTTGQGAFVTVKASVDVATVVNTEVFQGVLWDNHFSIG